MSDPANAPLEVGRQCRHRATAGLFATEHPDRVAVRTAAGRGTAAAARRPQTAQRVASVSQRSSADISSASIAAWRACSVATRPGSLT